MPTSLENGGVRFPDNSIQTTAATGGGDYIMRTYTSPSPWTAPAALKAVRVTVIGAGGAGGNAVISGPGFPTARGAGGGGGAGVQTYYDAPALSPLTITAGAGTNSFGALVSCTAGAAGGSTPNTQINTGGAGGAVTPSPTILLAFNGQPGQPSASGFTGGGGSGFFGLGLGGPSNSSPASAPGINGLGIGAAGGGGTRGPGASPLVGTNPGGAGTPGIVIVEEFY
jgi:hypothetical protein